MFSAQRGALILGPGGRKHPLYSWEEPSDFFARGPREILGQNRGALVKQGCVSLQEGNVSAGDMFKIRAQYFCVIGAAIQHFLKHRAPFYKGRQIFLLGRPVYYTARQEIWVFSPRGASSLKKGCVRNNSRQMNKTLLSPDWRDFFLRWGNGVI